MSKFLISKKRRCFFSINVMQIFWSRVADILQVNITLATKKYMGLPSIIKDIVWKKINYWEGISLSKVEKKVMIKLV